MNLYFLCDKAEKKILSLGPLPETWATISGLNEGMGDGLMDFTWAGYPNEGFFTEEQALELGINVLDIALCTKGRNEIVWQEIRQYRNTLINQIRWRIERHSDEIALGLAPTEDLAPVLQYIQALRDVTNQSDPMNLDWPKAP